MFIYNSLVILRHHSTILVVHFLRWLISLSFFFFFLFLFIFILFFFPQSLTLQGACECPRLPLESLSRDATVHLTGQDTIILFAIVFFSVNYRVQSPSSVINGVTLPPTIYFLLHSLFVILLRKNFCLHASYFLLIIVV